MMTVRIPVDGNRAAEHVGRAAVSLLPGVVAQDRRARRGRQIFSLTEITAHDRRDPERPEEVVAHARAGARSTPAGVPRRTPPP